jgi:hypothetical protein
MNKLINTILMVLLFPVLSFAQDFQNICGLGSYPCGTALVGGINLQNQQVVSAANTAVSITLSAVQNVRHHVHGVEARCSAGTSGLTITDGGTTIWSTVATEVGVVNFTRQWRTALTGTTNSQVVVTLATCGVGNTGTLSINADRF